MGIPLCEQCQKEVKRLGRRFCGRSCSNRWQHANGVRKGGFPKPLFQQWIDKFGLEVAQQKEIERNQKHSKSITGKKNHFFGKDHSVEFKKHSSKRHKDKVVSEEVRQKMSDSHARSIANGTHNPGNHFGKGGWYKRNDGTREYFSSSFEKIRMQFLDSSNLVRVWTKNHGLVIQYQIDNKTRSYAPDFLIETNDGRVFIEEVKGWVRDEREFLAKNEAAARFAEEHGMVFVVKWKDDLEKI